MRNYVGLDVSLKSTAICILDEQGKIKSKVSEVKAKTGNGWLLEAV
jgi:hypothetical protein